MYYPSEQVVYVLIGGHNSIAGVVSVNNRRRTFIIGD